MIGSSRYCQSATQSQFNKKNTFYVFFLVFFLVYLFSLVFFLVYLFFRVFFLVFFLFFSFGHHHSEVFPIVHTRIKRYLYLRNWFWFWFWFCCCGWFCCCLGICCGFLHIPLADSRTMIHNDFRNLVNRDALVRTLVNGRPSSWKIIRVPRFPWTHFQLRITYVFAPNGSIHPTHLQVGVVSGSFNVILVFFRVRYDTEYVPDLDVFPADCVFFASISSNHTNISCSEETELIWISRFEVVVHVCVWVGFAWVSLQVSHTTAVSNKKHQFSLSCFSAFFVFFSIFRVLYWCFSVYFVFLCIFRVFMCFSCSILVFFTFFGVFRHFSCVLAFFVFFGIFRVFRHFSCFK